MKKNVYVIRDKIEGLNIAWYINYEKRIVTCVLESKAKTCKASHGDIFDPSIGMAISFFKCYIANSEFEKMDSLTKFRRKTQEIVNSRFKRMEM